MELKPTYYSQVNTRQSLWRRIFIHITIILSSILNKDISNICDEIKVKLAAWKCLLLNVIGRVQRIKAIMHIMYIFDAYL